MAGGRGLWLVGAGPTLREVPCGSVTADKPTGALWGRGRARDPQSPGGSGSQEVTGYCLSEAEDRASITELIDLVVRLLNTPPIRISTVPPGSWSTTTVPTTEVRASSAISPSGNTMMATTKAQLGMYVHVIVSVWGASRWVAVPRMPEVFSCRSLSTSSEVPRTRASLTCGERGPRVDLTIPHTASATAAVTTSTINNSFAENIVPPPDPQRSQRGAGCARDPGTSIQLYSVMSHRCGTLVPMGREREFDDGVDGLDARRDSGGSGGAGTGDAERVGSAGVVGTVGSLGSDPFGLTGALEAARKAVAVDPGFESDQTLMASVVALEDLRCLIETTEARVLAHLDATAATDAALGMRTGRWLAWEADTGKSKCSARVGTARRLGWFDGFIGAMAEGRVSYAHGELLASVANIRNRDALREVEQQLVDLAVSYSFDEWAMVVRQLALDLDSDGSYDPNEDPDANRMRITDHGDGTAEVRGHLAGDAAATLTQVVERIADELFHRYRRDAEEDPVLPVPARSRLMAEALAEICRRAMAVDLDSTGQPRVEATVVIDLDPRAGVHGHLGSDCTPGGPSGDVGASRDAVQLRCRDLDGRVIPNSVAETLLVDPVVRGLLLDGAGAPLYLGDRFRFATPDQKHALAIRDGGCIFPGCDMPPSWCDAHHQPGWKPDGRTDIDTMFLACRHHHRVTHRSGWRCDPDPQRAQQWTWRTPSGHELYSQRNRGQPTA